ncbi:hypothetical protein [Streptomyces sp. AP-93]|uniref:hypothetical protein n=1 Tax=Streptomyces sp. AP-93 TaxID=2929048 RepID=UPI001FAED431|nr:hypothetical protein [Streptomyces sp. AP-93]MCJ0868556.1 hypothetical protein [Streptomyces sp. AP-93]
MASGASRWEQVAQQADSYETAVAVLLSLLNQDVLRIDGSGGDGGRDALFRRDDGTLAIYEMKSFTGRLDHSRRRKVENSLARAAEHGPTSWTLVVPIDQSPAELDWFEGLRSRHPFPLSWYGLNWLRARELEQPAFANYYLHEGFWTTHEIMRQLATGQLVAVSDGADAVARVGETVTRLNETEPHYRFSVTAGPNGESISMEPAYPGAETDRPTTLSLKAAFPDTPEGRDARAAWDQFLDFGDPVELTGDHLARVVLDLPAGLGIHNEPPHASALLRFGPRQVPGLSIPARAVIEDEDGRRLASLTVDLQVGHRGRRGAVATGTDRTGSLKIVLRLDQHDRTARTNLSLSPVPDMQPSDRLSLLRFARQARPPHRFQLYLHNKPVGPSVPCGDVSSKTISSSALDDEIALMEKLCEVQRRTGTPFGVPESVSPGDWANILLAHQLLAGQTAEVPPSLSQWTFPRPADLPPVAAALLAVGERVELSLSEPEFSLDICGHPVPLGAAEVTMPGSLITSVTSTDEGTEDIITAQPLAPRARRTVRLFDVPTEGH